MNDNIDYSTEYHFLQQSLMNYKTLGIFHLLRRTVKKKSSLTKLGTHKSGGN